MNAWRWLAAFCLAAFALPPSAAWAQQTPPHIGYVYPAGGQRGTTFRVEVGGQFLDGVREVRISGEGVHATLGKQAKPLTGKEAQQLRDKLTELQKGKKNAETWKQIEEIRRKLGTFNKKMKKSATPAIGETVVVQVVIDGGAELGTRQLRLETPRGLANPLVFCVGYLPEFCEQERPESQQPAAGGPKGRREFLAGNLPVRNPRESATEITLPAVVNGQIKPEEDEFRFRQQERFVPGDVDCFRFAARKGQQLVLAVSARQLIPYLADAVPGWFQATLTLYDEQGKEVAYDDDYRFHPDPVLFYKVPRDGQYTVEIKDALYRSRADFVYRITIGEVPFITSIFPLGGPAGKQTTVALQGWNLPADTLTMDARDKTPGIYPLCVHKGDWVSNCVPFAVDNLPECVEQEPNDSPQKAQPVALPVVVNGRIDHPGDWDVFRFEGRSGQRIIAEVTARRLDSPLDSLLKLTDTAGKQIAFNDDFEDKGDGLNTHHADSLLNVTLPADGVYYLHLGDAQQQGGPEYAYRLRISAPQPDFALRVAPSSISARSGTNVPITVYALRKDGFSGAIALSLKDAPEGFALGGGLIPAGQDQMPLTLTISRTAPTSLLRLSLEGRGTIAGREVVHRAVPAEDMMQAFAYRHLVPAGDFWVAIAGRFNPQDAAAAKGRNNRPGKFAQKNQKAEKELRILNEGPVEIPAGGTAQVRVAMPSYLLKNRFEIELSDPPEGMAIESVAPLADGLAIAVHCDGKKAKAGLKGNLIANAYVKTAVKSKDGKPRPDSRYLMGTLPAIPFEIVPR